MAPATVAPGRGSTSGGTVGPGRVAAGSVVPGAPARVASGGGGDNPSQQRPGKLGFYCN